MPFTIRNNNDVTGRKMKVKEITNVSEYVDYIESLKNNKSLWFRGVSSETHKPLPGLVWRNIQHQESSLEHAFLISYKSYLNSGSLNSWEIFALMQHHGLPTRLLDWSESALVALYFALSSEPRRNGDRAVWVMNPYQLNLKSLGLATLYCPAVINNRVINTPSQGLIDLDGYLGPNLKNNLTNIPRMPVAINTTQSIRRVSTQKGCFTVHGSSSNSIDQYFGPQDEFYKIRVNIKNDEHRLLMINTISTLGIDEEFIFQDLDALCNKVKRLCGVHY